MDYPYYNTNGLSPTPSKPYVERWEFFYELTTAATTYPVSLADAKAFAKIDPTGDDDADTENDSIITELIKAATGLFEDQTGRALSLQTWTAWLDFVPSSPVLMLSKGRIDSVTSISGYDDDGTAETMDTDDFSIDSHNARIGRINGASWPTATRYFKGFGVEFVAGYQSDEIPEEAQTAIMQIVAHWFENRQTVTEFNFKTIPFSTQLLINRLSVAVI